MVSASPTGSGGCRSKATIYLACVIVMIRQSFAKNKTGAAEARRPFGKCANYEMTIDGMGCADNDRSDLARRHHRDPTAQDGGTNGRHARPNMAGCSSSRALQAPSSRLPSGDEDHAGDDSVHPSNRAPTRGRNGVPVSLHSEAVAAAPRSGYQHVGGPMQVLQWCPTH
jgi:hypothetical protein